MARGEFAQVSVVVDATVVLAILFDEPGGDIVASMSHGAVLSAVNAVEVLEKLVERRGGAASDAATLPERLDITIVPFDKHQTLLAAEWKPLFAGKDISLAERACLALGRYLELLVLTAERAWTQLDVGVDIRLIR
jgi:PIN domain nuclease of toxin-antitoxin system